ncbi:MAG: SDR family oxidoreductase [Rhodobiaceae bacterium]|nr:SDR family oxidoreductase [Rhodobiaceae bacterium]
MKIIIFGATGSLGRHLVEQALAQGEEVTAFLRDASTLDRHHQNLHLVEGNVLDPVAVDAAVKGHDAALIALGAGRKGGVRAQGTKHIIDAMERHNVRRLVCQTTLGAGDSHTHLNFFWKHIMFGWLLKQAMADHEEQETYIRQSNLDWITVRPAAFTDGPTTGDYRLGFPQTETSLALKISRADVASVMLQQMTSDLFLHKSPGLSY